MLVTVSGITTLSKLVQLINASFPIDVIPSLITIVFNEEHCEKALCPMLVTPDGITILLSDAQPSNA